MAHALVPEGQFGFCQLVAGGCRTVNVGPNSEGGGP